MRVFFFRFFYFFLLLLSPNSNYAVVRSYASSLLTRDRAGLLGADDADADADAADAAAVVACFALLMCGGFAGNSLSFKEMREREGERVARERDGEQQKELLNSRIYNCMCCLQSLLYLVMVHTCIANSMQAGLDTYRSPLFGISWHYHEMGLYNRQQLVHIYSYT